MVTSTPTRRSAAAVASPPIPAPMIATESLFTWACLVFPKGNENSRNVLSRLFRFGRDLNGREFLELDIVEFAINSFDPADIYVLDHLTGFRIDRDRPARAFPRH